MYSFTTCAAFDWRTILVPIMVLTVAVFYNRRYSYWRKKGLETLPVTIPFGNAWKFFTGQYSLGQHFKDVHDRLKAKGLKHGGSYFLSRPFYIVTDPDIIKHILVTDFSHFVDHGLYFNEKVDPLSGHLFNLQGAKWRKMRVKLTPTFTSGKMKMMFQTFVDCTIELKKILKNAANDGHALEIKDILGRLTTDVIGSCALGLECNSLGDPEATFRHYGRRFFENTLREVFEMKLKSIIPTKLLSKMNVRLVKPDVAQFFLNSAENIVNYRESNNVQREDLMQLLIRLKNGENVEKDGISNEENGGKLTMGELAAQAFGFFTAGYETSSNAMTFALFELATNLQVQEQLRKEIRVALKRNNEITYNGLMEMTYLDKVVAETLRKYPPLPIITRRCTKDYRVPGTTLTIDKGTPVRIATLGLHYDPQYYPEPEKFNPDRFSEENKNNRPAFTWLPFGEGPRHCIGLRFGLLQIKIGLAMIVKDFKITLNTKTKLPLEINTNTIILTSKRGVWLNFEHIH